MMEGTREVLSRNIKTLTKDYSYRELSQLIYDETGTKLAHTTLHQYAQGKRVPRTEQLEALAQFFRREVSWFYSDHSDEGRWIPVLGVIRAGQPLLAHENIIDYEEIPQSLAKTGDYFFLQVQGESMEGAHIPDGAYVLVRKQGAVENGEIAVVMVNEHDATVKRIYKQEDAVVLHADNPAYEPQIITDKNFRVIGKVEEVRIRM